MIEIYYGRVYMNKKKVLIISLIMNIICIIIIIILGFKLIDKNTKVDLIDNQETNYRCIQTYDWQDFDVTFFNGNELGKYREINVYSFKLDDENKLKENTDKIVHKLEFENLDGYGYARYNLDGCDEKTYESELIKEYTCYNTRPFAEFSDITSYLSKLSELGYQCNVTK